MPAKMVGWEWTSLEMLSRLQGMFLKVPGLCLLSNYPHYTKIPELIYFEGLLESWKYFRLQPLTHLLSTELWAFAQMSDTMLPQHRMAKVAWSEGSDELLMLEGRVQAEI